ncbi:DegT/DnrJ/EryC1/StrS aminotransferase family protein [uncultured Aquimarina sp.]|uniref:DegT/DnrJ/EryC1/StrS family aminotransferase n=1 Tax=uncultured Aquimarina sp. TaxID=575652 RepID=UPI00262DA183|nr:DegT/DnrJ/EryC1/StrS family aminotransferase [uncultured Aquimarina sp.]
MTIDFANLTKAYLEHKSNIDEAINNVVSTSRFIMGKEVVELESALEEYTGAKYAISCSSGTDALLLAMMALDIKPGDEIITTPFTFIATAETIAFLGAIPVFVDIDERTYNIDVNRIEEKINERTKAIMPVSLYGQIADMDEINKLGRKHNIVVIEDAAQSFGATYKGGKSCNLSTIGCTSFFPAKPLGCYGDGGALFTNDEQLANKIKSMRVHGQTQRYMHKYVGMGGRLDTLQAAVLLEKLKYYENDVKRRQAVARQYDQHLQNIAIIPFIKEEKTSVWAQYSIRVNKREEVQSTLKKKGIPTAVHYPKPLHLQECFEYLGYTKGDFPISEKVSNEIMSLPMNPYLTSEEINYIAEELKKIL